MSQQTICAPATPPGQAGIGIIRVSGDKTSEVAKQLIHFEPKPRYAHYTAFYSKKGEMIDQGIVLFYPAPHSFTGDDVLEFHCHGGRYVLERLLNAIIDCGVELAQAGEFSKRAFLNGKIDLLQAEAIADLIGAGSEQAAASALHSLTGEFSNRINQLLEQITQLRIFVEATIDFSDEEIDFIPTDKVAGQLNEINTTLTIILNQAKQGSVLQQGVRVVIAGKPNAGKSSLFNALIENESAIVTAVAGTTRDVIKEHIVIDGVPFNVIDTAGLRQSDDEIEQEGVRRARSAINQADITLLVYDGREAVDLSLAVGAKTLLLVKNKCDLLAGETRLKANEVVVSAKEKIGLDKLRAQVKALAGIQMVEGGVILARKRHLIALDAVLNDIKNAQQQVKKGATELVAEELRQAQYHLGEITGQVNSDQLLGKIFSSFCIGK